MILLQKNQLNKVALTLTELANPLNPNYWLFVFKLEQSQGDEEYSKRVQFTDLSIETDRYNYFEITEGVDITFDMVGFYEYYIFQMPDQISTDENDGLLVEVGKANISGDEETNYTHSVATNTYING
tara:strand:+ start:5438 stop:5818 length:381 start_codon:yes stop_codon:yes gene_type:complete